MHRLQMNTPLYKNNVERKIRIDIGMLRLHVVSNSTCTNDENVNFAYETWMMGLLYSYILRTSHNYPE